MTWENVIQALVLFTVGFVLGTWATNKGWERRR